LIANMPTIVTDKKFADVTAYPDIAKEYAYTLNSLKTLRFDIWLASHASQFNLHSKHKPGDVYSPAAFVDREGYDIELKELQNKFDKKMQDQ
jgi:metallo-beta-lactamase class B